jgi:hypothetical protein
MDGKDISSAETTAFSAVGHPPSPWTPTSYSVTTHGPADKPALESPDQVSLPIETFVTPQERPKSPWTPSYSTTVQVSNSTNRTGDDESTVIDADVSSPDITGPSLQDERGDREGLYAAASPTAELRELAAVPPHLLQISDEQDARDESKVATEAVNEPPIDVPSESPFPNVSWRIRSLV